MLNQLIKFVDMSNEFKVGLIGILGLITLYLGSNFLKGYDFFSSTKTYYVVYDNVDGLIISNPVILNGYSIGRVSEIDILQEYNNQILVTLDINNDLVIGDTSLATLSSNDVLGSKAIILSIGNIDNPLKEGDTIRADVDRGLTELIESAGPITDNLSVTISRLNDLLLSLQGSGDLISKTLNNFNNVLNSTNSLINDNESNLTSTVDNLEDLTNNLNSKIEKIDPLLSSIQNTFDDLNKIKFEKTFNQIDKLLSSMNNVFDDIENGEGTLSKLLKEDSLYNNLNKTAYDLDKLLNHINENPKHFFAPFGKNSKKIKKDLQKKKN